MDFIWNNAKLVNWILTIALILVIYGLLFVVIHRVVKRKAGFVVCSLSLFFVLASYILCLDGVMIVASMVSAVALTLSLFANLGDLRAFLANPFRRASGKNVNFGVEKI